MLVCTVNLSKCHDVFIIETCEPNIERNRLNAGTLQKSILSWL